MLIANPIYDVVFKYLMEDSKVAKLLIGSIIGAEVLELEFRPKSYILNVREEDFPEEFRSIIRRLQKAVEVPEIRDNMEAEDTYLEELENQERRALEAEKIAKEAFKQIAEEKQKTEEAERKIEQEKQRAEQEKQRAEQAEYKLHESFKRMRQAGLPDVDICAFLNISPEELERMTNFSNDE